MIAGKLITPQLGLSGSQRSRAATLDSQGRAVVAGRFSGSIDSGGGPLMSAGDDDVFLTKLTF